MFLFFINDSIHYGPKMIRHVLKVAGHEDDPRVIPDKELLEGEAGPSVSFVIREDNRNSWSVWLPNDPEATKTDALPGISAADCIQRVSATSFAKALPPRTMQGRICASCGNLWRDIEATAYAKSLCALLDAARALNPADYCALIMIDINPTEGATTERNSQGVAVASAISKCMASSYPRLIAGTQLWVHSSLTAMKDRKGVQSVDSCLEKMNMLGPGMATQPFLTESPKRTGDPHFAPVVRRWLSLG